MSRSLVRPARSHPRTIALAGAGCALAAAATLVVTGSAQATSPTPPTTPTPCRLATLQGTYLFEGNGASVSGTTTTPTAFAGSEHFTGAGAVAGSSTFSSGGTIFPRSPFTGAYTLNANCTGTLGCPEVLGPRPDRVVSERRHRKCLGSIGISVSSFGTKPFDW